MTLIHDEGDHVTVIAPPEMDEAIDQINQVGDAQGAPEYQKELFGAIMGQVKHQVFYRTAEACQKVLDAHNAAVAAEAAKAQEAAKKLDPYR
jgi:hypothetical protein